MAVRAGTSGRRRVKKKIKRKKSLGASNLKLQGRRRAVTEFNALLIQRGADALIWERKWLGKLVASAWQARGKLVASGPFFWQAPVLPFWGRQKGTRF